MRLATLQFETKLQKCIRIGDNHIQNFHLGRYIVGYTLGNHVLRLHSRVAVKQNFRPYIRRYTSPNENFEYSYPLLNYHIFLISVICIDMVELVVSGDM